MSLMNGVPDHCPSCDEWGFGNHKRWSPSVPALPAMLFSLIPARAARLARWTFECVWCGHEETYEHTPQTTTPQMLKRVGGAL